MSGRKSIASRPVAAPLKSPTRVAAPGLVTSNEISELPKFAIAYAVWAFAEVETVAMMPSESTAPVIAFWKKVAIS
ncbi:MAG: hypothetical protein H8F28_25565 [Fibrella sp.]|nr:hypothetical protein [Armatimonadota bacterium]